MPDLLVPKGGAQEKFVLADEEYVALISGYGLGKSYILCAKMILLAQTNMGTTGLMVAHSYDQLVGNLIPTYKKILEEWGIPYTYKISEYKIILPWGDVLFRTADRPIVGFTCGYAGVDEACLCKDSAFKDILARVRDVKAKKPQKLFTSTPEGRTGWIYKNMVEKPLPDSKLITGSSSENKRNQVDGYIDSLEGAFNGRMQQAYLHGMFIDIRNQPAYMFVTNDVVAGSWVVNTTYGSFELMQLDTNEELIASFDFGNVISTCIIAQKSKAMGFTRVRILDEIWLKDSNTWELAEKLVQEYGDKGLQLRVHGDATGQHNRGSAATQSDYDVIRKLCIGHFRGITFDIPTANSRVIDRITAVNSALKGGKNFQMRIHPKCVNLIRDLQEVSFMDDGSRRLNKKKDKELSHISDALGYMIQQCHTPLQEFNRIRSWS